MREESDEIRAEGSNHFVSMTKQQRENETKKRKIEFAKEEELVVVRFKRLFGKSDLT